MITARHLLRSAPIGVGLAAIMVALSACSGPSTPTPSPTPSRGQSAEAAERVIEGIPGVAKASVSVNKSVSGLNKHYQIWTDVTVEDGATIPDPGELIDALVQVSWSVNAVHPDQGVLLSVTTSPQIDVGPIAEQSGWSGVTYQTKNATPTNGVALFAADDVAARFGAWPAATPSAVSGLIVPAA